MEHVKVYKHLQILVLNMQTYLRFIGSYQIKSLHNKITEIILFLACISVSTWNCIMTVFFSSFHQSLEPE